MSDDFRSFLAGERQRWVAYVRSLVSETTEMDAEDVVQDVLLRLLERADLIPRRPEDSLIAYVYRSLRNRVIDRARAKKPNVSLDLEVDDQGTSFVELMRDTTPTIVEKLQTDEGQSALFAALEQLSEVERDVIIAHEFEGIPFRELEVRFNTPQNTLLSHKARGMTKLKQILEDQEEER